MKARVTAESILRKLPKAEQQALINYMNHAIDEQREHIGFRAYAAGACAAYDSFGVVGDDLERFIICFDDIISGHADQVYRGKPGPIRDLADDMMAYLRDEGVECESLELLYEKMYGRAVSELPSSEDERWQARGIWDTVYHGKGGRHYECQRCGAKTVIKSRFCASCGKRMRSEVVDV